MKRAIKLLSERVAALEWSLAGLTSRMEHERATASRDNTKVDEMRKEIAELNVELGQLEMDSG